MKPDVQNLKLDFFAVTDFTGLFAVEDIQDLIGVELDFCSIFEEYQFTGAQSYSLKYLFQNWRQSILHCLKK